MLLRKRHYLQIALNSNLDDARNIISKLPKSDRIIIEAGTPLIKDYGSDVISELKSLWQSRLNPPFQTTIEPYIVADLKCMDRGEAEAAIASNNGASGAVVLGLAPIETINSFIESCNQYDIDSMVDMMNVDKPYQVLRKIKKLPRVVILHRGVDEEKFSDKPLPIYLINKIKGSFDVMISIAGGDTPREIQSAVFNGADIVVLWKNFYTPGSQTAEIAEQFLREIK
ncbi:MAG: orotidine 5'-phosphate decarboxylase / HUMPS family protein [Candidatus Levybacteria bacterium]|nr:orotidine 5'-phosphate decarboxylase / HUMPS family protein [Candidatus Levybacteria bacterium]